ncbi:hypothetical protein LCGC14_0884440 [marine sediment metagenome]|uniref:Uncharacterized protein n=1 Tax=marine sediment metagenome TaxID=412755 RepID=A0A0F9P5X1_9ZZZZ
MTVQGLIYDELNSTGVFTQGEASYYAKVIAKRSAAWFKSICTDVGVTSNSQTGKEGVLVRILKKDWKALNLGK